MLSADRHAVALLNRIAELASEGVIGGDLDVARAAALGQIRTIAEGAAADPPIAFSYARPVSCGTRSGGA